LIYKDYERTDLFDQMMNLVINRFIKPNNCMFKSILRQYLKIDFVKESKRYISINSDVIS